MSRQFDGAHVAFGVVAADDQREALQIDDEFRIDAEVAVVAFMGVQAAVGPRGAGVRLKNDVAGFFHQRAAKRSDHQPASAVGFRMTGVVPAHHVAGVLDDGVLKTAAGAEERHVVFPRMTDRHKGAVVVTIWAARHHPDGVEILQDVGGGQGFCR